MQTSFSTIKSPSESFIKEKNSKFYGFVLPVKNKLEVKKELEDLRGLYPDATHHCYAYLLGIDQKEERANDDGEPSSSAGKPILRQILSAGVTNVLVVVVRYYGGKKLGVPGLIYAYGEAAKIALDNTEIVEQQVMIQYRASCPYGDENHLYRIAKRLDIELEIMPSMTQFECRFSVALAIKDQFEASFIDLHKIELEKEEEPS